MINIKKIEVPKAPQVPVKTITEAVPVKDEDENNKADKK